MTERDVSQPILICCSSFPPEKGGAPVRIYHMARLLLEAGYRVTVITAMPNYPTGRIFDGYRGRLVQRGMVEGIEVIRLALFPSNSRNLALRGLSTLSYLASVLLLAGRRLLFGKASLVVVSSPPLFSAWLFALLACCGRKKVLLNISDLWPLTTLEMRVMRDGLAYRLMQRLERQLYRLADAFTGQSNEILAYLQTSKPAFLYRNLQPVKTSDGEVTRRPSRSLLRLLYAGNLGHAQGMLALCRSIDFARAGAHLTVYGAGAELEDLTAFVAAHPDRGITLRTTVPQAELDLLLTGYDAVLVPLGMPIRGAVPSKLFMAVAAGLPVLLMSGGEGAALVKQHELGWVVPPGDYQQLEAVIRQIASATPDVLVSIREKILLARETVFSKRQQDKAYLAFIGQLVR